MLAGSGTVDFAVFIAFCTIYPNVEIFFSFKAKWIAAVILGINSLFLLSRTSHDGRTASSFGLRPRRVSVHQVSPRPAFGSLWAITSGSGVLAGVSVPVPGPRTAPERKPPTPRDDVIESIDPLLDKIAKHGIGSLSPRERQKLEQAREELLKKP